MINTHVQRRNSYTILNQPLPSQKMPLPIPWIYFPSTTSPVTVVICTYMGIVYTYIYTVPTKIYNRHETDQTPISQPHCNILVHYSLIFLIPTISVVAPSRRSCVPSFINTMIIHNRTHITMIHTTWCNRISTRRWIHAIIALLHLSYPRGTGSDQRWYPVILTYLTIHMV